MPLVLLGGASSLDNLETAIDHVSTLWLWAAR
jgi:hypothetical protein